MRLTPEMLAACVSWPRGPTETDLLPACRWAMAVSPEKADLALDRAICEWPFRDDRDAFRGTIGETEFRNPLSAVSAIVVLAQGRMNREMSAWGYAINYWVDLATKYST